MIVLFYDRKNKRQVRSDQLMSINLCESYAAVSDEGFGPGTPVKTLTDKYGDECLVIATRILATIGYKSENCPKYCNWDLWTTINDLIFLNFEEEYDSSED